MKKLGNSSTELQKIDQCSSLSLQAKMCDNYIDSGHSSSQSLQKSERGNFFVFVFHPLVSAHLEILLPRRVCAFQYLLSPCRMLKCNPIYFHLKYSTNRIISNNKVRLWLCKKLFATGAHLSLPPHIKAHCSHILYLVVSIDRWKAFPGQNSSSHISIRDQAFLFRKISVLCYHTVSHKLIFL